MSVCPADVITNDPIKSRTNVDERSFFWTHYMDVHYPRFPPEIYRGRHNKGDTPEAEISKYYSTALENFTTLDYRATWALYGLYEVEFEYIECQSDG